MTNVRDALANWPEPAIRYQARVWLFGDDPAAADVERLQAEIKTRARVQCLRHRRSPMNPFVTVHALHVLERTKESR